MKKYLRKAMLLVAMMLTGNAAMAQVGVGSDAEWRAVVNMLTMSDASLKSRWEETQGLTNTAKTNYDKAVNLYMSTFETALTVAEDSVTKKYAKYEKACTDAELCTPKTYPAPDPTLEAASLACSGVLAQMEAKAEGDEYTITKRVWVRFLSASKNLRLFTYDPQTSFDKDNATKYEEITDAFDESILVGKSWSEVKVTLYFIDRNKKTEKNYMFLGVAVGEKTRPFGDFYDVLSVCGDYLLKQAGMDDVPTDDYSAKLQARDDAWDAYLAALDDKTQKNTEKTNAAANIAADPSLDDNVKGKYDLWQSAIETEQAAKKAYETAHTDRVKAETNIYFTADFNATVSLPAAVNYAGTIDGQDCIVTLEGSSMTFLVGALAAEGEVTNLIVNDGVIVQNGKLDGKITHSACNKNPYYYIYDNAGNVTTFQETNAGEFGYTYRADYGQTIDGHIAHREDNTIVYLAKHYRSADNWEPGSGFYTHIINGTLDNMGTIGAMNNNEFIVLYGTPIVSSSSSSSSRVDIPNVIYQMADGSFRCENVVVTDGMDWQTEFFCPVDFQAGSVVYQREYNPGWASACLPFAIRINGSYTGLVEHLAVYNGYDLTAEAISLKYVDEVPANTPTMVKFKSAGKIELSEVPFTATNRGEVMYQGLEDDEEGIEGLMGTYVMFTLDDDKHETNKYRYYGFSTKGTFVEYLAGVTFVPFRSYIKMKRDTMQGSNNVREFSVRFTDPDGILTGIDEVEVAVPAFKAAGTQGAICVAADKETRVSIFTISGARVKEVTVQAGVTNIPVPAGAYIANGVKVIVK